MYGSGRGLGLASGGVGAGLATTGFPVFGFTLLAVVVILLGLALVRHLGVKQSGA